MIGVELKEKGRKGVWRVTGQHAGLYVLHRVDAFEAAEYVTAATLSTRFKVAAEEPTQPSEDEGWEALAAIHEAQEAEASEPTPEDVFASYAE